MSDDSYVLVWRRSEQSKRMVFMGRLAPSEATEEVLQRCLGGGYYTLREKVPDDLGRMKFGRSRTLELGGPFRPNGTLESVGDNMPSRAVGGGAALPSGAPAAPAVPDIIGAGILQLFQAAQTQQQMMTQMFTNSQQSQAALLQAILSKGDSKNDMTEILKAIVPLATAYLAQPKQERDPLDMLKAVGEIVRSNQGKQSDSVSDTIAAMKDLLEMREMLSPDSGGDDPLLSAVPKLVEVIAEEQASRRRGTGDRKPWVAPKVEKIPSGETPVIPLAQPMYVRILRAEGKRLIASAKENRDPEFVADVALEFAPEAIKPALIEFFGMEDCGDKIVATLPELVPYRPWVDAFVVAARDIIFGEEDEETEPPAGEPPAGEEGPHVSEGQR